MERQDKTESFTGSDFNKKKKGTYLKLLKKDMTYDNFKFSLGLNIYDGTFVPKRNKVTGFNITNSSEILSTQDLYFEGGLNITNVDIPDDAVVYCGSDGKYRTDKLVLKKINLDEKLKAFNKDILFILSCASGDINVTKKMANSIDDHTEGFKFACRNQNIDIARFLHTQNKIKNIDIYNFLFCYNCFHGNLEMAKCPN